MAPLQSGVLVAQTPHLPTRWPLSLHGFVVCWLVFVLLCLILQRLLCEETRMDFLLELLLASRGLTSPSLSTYLVSACIALANAHWLKQVTWYRVKLQSTYKPMSSKKVTHCLSLPHLHIHQSLASGIRDESLSQTLCVCRSGRGRLPPCFSLPDGCSVTCSLLPALGVSPRF